MGASLGYSSNLDETSQICEGRSKGRLARLQFRERLLITCAISPLNPSPLVLIHNRFVAQLNVVTSRSVPSVSPRRAESILFAATYRQTKGHKIEGRRGKCNFLRRMCSLNAMSSRFMSTQSALLDF